MNYSPTADSAISNINRIIGDSISVKQQILFDMEIRGRIVSAIELLTKVFQNGGKVFFCGNGGSAADAQHLAAEFSGRFYKDRDPLPAEALHSNTSYLTAVANDYGYEYVFSRLLKGAASGGDVVVGLSTSGNSRNVIEAFKQAKEMGVSSIALTGMNGALMGEIADILINVPSTDTPRIQESHILIGHIICEVVEANLF